jgi:23S rRNA (cytidine1920-2'-O)/16S rRNA (cytidine1409-2'-O)-methyltransferase
VVRDPAVHRAILCEVRDAAGGLGLAMVRLTASPLIGPAGNREFLGEFRRKGTPVDEERIAAVVGEGAQP